MDRDTVKNNIITTFNTMVYEKGLKQTNLDDLSRELKISKKTIYKYFHSKDELVVGVVDGIIQNVTEISEKYMSGDSSPIEKYMNTMTYVGNYLSGINQRLMTDIQILYPELWDKINEVRSKKLALFSEIIQGGINDGTFREIQPTVAVQMITASISAILNPAFLSVNSFLTEEAVASLKTVFLDGIKKV